MTNQITIVNEQDFKIDGDRLRLAVLTTLRQEGDLQSQAITIVITDNEEIRNLNQQFRHVDRPTDVLSFPADELPDEFQMEDRYLGDIVIAFPYVVEQANEYGHHVNDNLDLMAVHGTLHLLGYDHDTFENRTNMWEKQGIILADLEIPANILPDLENFRPEN